MTGKEAGKVGRKTGRKEESKKKIGRKEREAEGNGRKESRMAEKRV